MNEPIEIERSQSLAGAGAAPAEMEVADWSASQVLSWAFQQYGDEIAIASAFGAEGIALIDMAAELRPRPRVFVLDTAFLFAETYRLIEHVEARYGIAVQRVLPVLSAEEQAESYGEQLWDRDPNLCCQLRKVEPLQKHLVNLRAWVTSIRRDQTPERAHTRKVAWDARFRIMKISPLADWSRDQVWQYIHERQLPYNPLHDRNYPSIGCVHCTRAVNPEENPRAGRWPGFPEKTECGLHSSAATLSLNDILQVNRK
jgi:phosphoadenosine phosphosulfate reductase